MTISIAYSASLRALYTVRLSQITMAVVRFVLARFLAAKRTCFELRNMGATGTGMAEPFVICLCVEVGVSHVCMYT